MKVGKTVFEMRTRRNMMQSEVSERAGISTTMLGLIERDKTNPTVGTLAKIAAAMDAKISVQFLDLNKEK